MPSRRPTIVRGGGAHLKRSDPLCRMLRASGGGGEFDIATPASRNPTCARAMIGEPIENFAENDELMVT